MNKEIETLLKSCVKYPPNLEEISDSLKTVDINEPFYGDLDGNLLCEVLLEYRYGDFSSEECDGKYIPDIVRVFLDSGFDLSKDDYRYGREVIAALKYAASDKYILDAAKLILDNSADTEAKDAYGEEIQELLSGYGTSESYARVCMHDWDEEMVCYTMYEIIEAYMKHQNYNGILYHTEAIGDTVESIYLCYEEENSRKGFYDIGGKKIFNNCYEGTLLLRCTKYDVVIRSTCPVIYLDYIENNCVSYTDVSEKFNRIIGMNISGFSNKYISIEGKKTTHTQKHFRVHFDNKKSLYIRDNFGEADNTNTFLSIE